MEFLKPYLTLKIIIPVGLAFLGFGIFVIINWWQNRERVAVVKSTASPQVEGKSEAKAEDKEEFKPVKVRLYDSVRHKIYNKVIGSDAVEYIIKLYGTLGRQWDFNGIPIYAINKYQNAGEETQKHIVRYRPVESVMEVTRQHSPSRVHDAIYHPEIRTYWDMQVEQSTLQKLMPLIWVGAGCVLAIFLLMNSK